MFSGTPKEVLSTAAVSELWQGKHGGLSRLLLYSLHEAETALKLMERLQTVPEIVEMARVTGLTLSDVLYKAQMVRVQSLLLRSARREGWLLGGTTLNGQLSESPFLLHPKENHTAGFYQDPIAVLDFASLYPSLFMAYNLCYTTLVHPEDAKTMPAHQLTTSPTGAQFVVASVRRGVLPRICGALITARKQARDRMAKENITPEEHAVLDGRQKALKLCSNALYGFTGASASPQQALPLADSCLSMGAASCKQAVQLAGSFSENGKVIYAQTDSVFVCFKGSSIDEAVKLGTQAAEIVSQAFPSPIVLKFERVLCPFLLLQVNRYAGKQYTSSEANKGQGTLFVKGIEAERRDVPRFVRQICKQALYDILVKNDVLRALENCKNSIRRVVAGKWSLSEYIMTGGLWRVDDNDITKLAAATKGSHKHVGASTAEEGRGPHVALSVRLKRKDPDRQFHIGERVPYVLMANSNKLQDDMAEDPIDALIGGIPVNTHVYLENKLRKPLESILEFVTDPSTLRELFSGSHTVPPPSAYVGAPNRTQGLVSSFFRPKTLCLICRKPLENGHGALCQECTLAGHAQKAATAIFHEMAEQELKLAGAHAECMRCHSGGHFQSVLCTNSDCPVLYMRYECPQSLALVESSLLKLDQQF